MLARKNDIFGNKDWKVIHTGIKVNLVDLDRMPNAAYTAPLHPHSCNQTSNLLTCTRPSLLSGNCSPASCPSGKWPCRAALSNAPIYWEPKEHLSASSPCQPLSIAVGWPETPSPSRTPHHAPHTWPMVCRASTDCVSMLGHPVGKACQRLAQGCGRKTLSHLKLCLATTAINTTTWTRCRYSTVESREQSGQESFLDGFSAMPTRKKDIFQSKEWSYRD